MSFAYQYGVETTPQPAASAKVSAPDAICSRFLYGVTKTSVAASRSELVDREEAIVELDVLAEAELGDARSSIRRYCSPSRWATSGWVRPAIR